MLAQLYGYTPQQIAEMTHEQQYLLISDSDSGEMKFKDFAEYQAWKAKGIL